jgi:glutamine synthetase
MGFDRVNARVTAATHAAASLVRVSPSAEAEYVLRAVEERGIRFVRLWFTDVLGFLKSFTITSQELEGAFAEGMGFDGSSIEGFSRIQESDMVARPDPSTFQLIPWRAEAQVARMFCDIQNPDGSAFDGDPRGVLKRQLQRAADVGFTFYVGPELEYFYFRSVDDPSFLDQGGYFDETPLDVATDWRKRTVAYLEAMGIPVEYVHHEVAPSQHEIDLRYTDALTMADNVMTYRLTVKEVAQEFGIYATFMPKPVMGVNGSGMHTHQSLFSGDRNAFFQEDDEYHLSKVGKHYIAGLLAHAPELTLLTNQWVNSYKRLVPGFEAPVYVCWARRNRSALVRVPMYKPGKEGATRIEFRSPDPACNPYLAFASMLAAGLEGVENEYELPPEASNNIYEMTAEERVAAGIRSLPEDLNEAIHAAQDSKVLRECLGEHVHEFLIRNKREEWDAYKAYVTPYELERYFPIL